MEQKNCVICGKEMECKTKPRGGRKRLGQKSGELAHNRVTCSKICSRENIRRQKG